MRWTARQEKFCLLIIAGEPHHTAYEQAGYSAKSKEVAAVAANQLLKNINVQKRMEELRLDLVKRSEITLDSLTADLIDIRAKAIAAGSFGPAVQATIVLAKMHGHLVEKSEVTVQHRPAPLPTKILELSEDEWRRQFGVEGKHQLLKNPPK